MTVDIVKQNLDDLVQQARAVQADLEKLAAADQVSDAQEQALAALVALAGNVEAGLPGAARELRQKKIGDLLQHIDNLKSLLLLPLTAGQEDTVRGQIADLQAQVSSLAARDLADYADLASPADVKQLVALLRAAHEDVVAKQRASLALSALGSAVSLAAQIIGRVLAAMAA